MTYELKLERVLDATPELVFDTFVDEDAHAELFSDSELGLRLLESNVDLRVGGTWSLSQEARGEGQYRLTYVFTEIDRPRRIAARFSMTYPDGHTDHSDVSLDFVDQDGKTLLTLVQSGFPTEEERDAYLGGAPGFLDALQRAVEKRAG